MTAFIAVAALMAAAALAWVLPGLLRRREEAAIVQPRAATLAVLKDQLAELEADLAAGTLPRDQYQQARQDLERRALEETRDAAAHVTAAGNMAPASWTAVVLAFAIPALAAILYVSIGAPHGVTQSPEARAPGQPSRHDVEGMVAKLAARMEQVPDDGKGWALLARSYLVLGRNDDAVAAYERAANILKDDADVLADYADALAMQQGRNIEGKPMKLIERALKIDPTQWKALAMAGSAAFDRKDYKTAIAYWQKLESRAEPGSEFARQVSANIQEASERAGIKVAAAPAMQPKGESAPKTAAAAPGGGKIEGQVSLTRELASKAAPTDTVFVFARAIEGPRMPLAIMRLQVKDLPAKFHLDDTMSMSPAIKLSSFPQVIIGARVSKSGSATPQSGDLQGISKPTPVGASGVSLVIDQQLP